MSTSFTGIVSKYINVDTLWRLSIRTAWYFGGEISPPNTKSKYTMPCLLLDELVGVIAVVVVIPVSRVPVMAVTLKSPNSRWATASRSLESTSLSLTVELNFRARSTITLPHLARKIISLSTNEVKRVSFEMKCVRFLS